MKLLSILSLLADLKSQPNVAPNEAAVRVVKQFVFRFEFNAGFSSNKTVGSKDRTHCETQVQIVWQHQHQLFLVLSGLISDKVTRVCTTVS